MKFLLFLLLSSAALAETRPAPVPQKTPDQLLLEMKDKPYIINAVPEENSSLQSVSSVCEFITNDKDYITCNFQVRYLMVPYVKTEDAIRKEVRERLNVIKKDDKAGYDNLVKTTVSKESCELTNKVSKDFIAKKKKSGETKIAKAYQELNSAVCGSGSQDERLVAFFTRDALTSHKTCTLKESIKVMQFKKEKEDWLFKEVIPVNDCQATIVHGFHFNKDEKDWEYSIDKKVDKKTCGENNYEIFKQTTDPIRELPAQCEFIVIDSEINAEMRR